MTFLRAHAVRIVAVLAALVPLLVVRFPEIDWYGLVAVVGALLGVGEVAQRVEDGKTRAALHETSPYDELAMLHQQLAAYEKNHSPASGR
ncbi:MULTISPECIES: hypothetical protein [Streptomyces]|uniref:hypothetical protein n=1 Tax=Streptomyces TaxID=1883 RepID=UPI001E45A7E2|nr:MULTISPECIES: hypothetical protein [Streptomyces]UFQ16426.1 hypothetical protein J2N69_16235 [Streptomyces huasconensis]WCL86028.1 hypothetical protein PPN52_16245 [Streptomyces sp. JCM 35825]